MQRQRDIYRSPIHPRNIYEPHSVAKRTSQLGLVMSELMLAPQTGIIDVSSYTAHALMITLSDTSVRQVNHVGDQVFEGAFPGGAFACTPTKTPLYASWESADDDLLFVIQPEWLEKLATETGQVNPDRIELLPVAMKQDPQMETLGRLFQQELLNDSLGGSLYYESLINLLGIHLLRHYCAFEAKPLSELDGLQGQKRQQAIAYIHDHLGQDISLNAIATYLEMSQYHFCRWFKQVMGTPPYEYVIQQRVEHAKRLLKDKKLTLADIALQCGFNSQSHLIRHFKKQTGLTPKQYRDL
ncbi:MAG: AraC family transcriptional regulator [Cyanobacteria bacterium J06634_6]